MGGHLENAKIYTVAAGTWQDTLSVPILHLIVILTFCRK